MLALFGSLMLANAPEIWGKLHWESLGKWTGQCIGCKNRVQNKNICRGDEPSADQKKGIGEP